MLVGRWGARALSDDHKPDRPDERRRIVGRGGTVMKVGVWRVEGMLAVSRAIGDRLLKRFVPPTPEVSVVDLEEEDQWVVLATDGLWDVVQSEELAAMMRGVSCPVQAARKLVFAALNRRSLDNVTVLVVDVRGAVQKTRALQAERRKGEKQADTRAGEGEGGEAEELLAGATSAGADGLGLSMSGEASVGLE